jgi:DNA-binding SARP family transcriptional activator/tetratricopeptide (TPR) repeat protein
MDFRILGPLEVLHEGGEVALGGPKQRALLALLVLHAGETVATERLIDDLWEESPPATAAKTAQVHVSRLRRALGADDLIETRERGYRLNVDPADIDAHRFERLVGAAREALARDSPEEAAAAASEALALWRGEPLAGMAHERFAQAEVGRLEDLRIAARELEIEAKLALGCHSEVIGPLEALIAEHPYRERLRAQLMLALYRCDRQADALQAYQNSRRTLVEELGIEPGERLRELEAAILAQDPSLALARREPARAPPPPQKAEPAPPPAGPRAGRRLVTILFADLVGSTALGERLDPESMHEVLDSVSELCGASIERHGGRVEGFIGDAVVGVFGIDELHEDDALRAVRAAVELRDELPELAGRLGREHGVEVALKLAVEAGEVFVSGGTRRRSFAAGDAFNVASRLQGSAAAGEILLGENVQRLLADAVSAEPLDEPLELRGRSAAVRAWRLVDVAGAPERPATSPFVDRERELELLRAAFERSREGRCCEPVTVVGPAGIGKSRLVRELAAGLGDAARLAVGRCQSYGEGTTYQPAAELVRQLDGTAHDDEAAALVPGATGGASSPAQPEEVFWAVRRLVERAAAERPVIALFEDVHWAEPTLLDLVDYLEAFASDAPILLVATTRPDLVDTRPAWLAPREDRTLVALEPLPDAEARRMVGHAEAADRIVEAAEGNPLFLEQLAAIDPGDEEGALPSTIQAVLAARIDALEPGPRTALETASVQGRAFHAGALAEQLDDPHTPSHLVALVRGQLIRPARSDLPGADTFRFAHALIREAAYGGLPRRRRAEVHRHMAAWLPEDRDEAIGNHLESAHRELTAIGAADPAVASEAAARLAKAAGAALVRGDPPGGARLLERAAALLDGAERTALLPRLGAALLEAGRLADAERVLAEAIDTAGGDAALEARATVELGLVRLQTGADDDGAALADRTLAAMEADGDLLGQSRALCLRARCNWVEGHAAAADEAWARAADLAERAGDEAALFEILDWRASVALFGPAPVPDAIARCEAIRERLSANPVAAARIMPPLAALHAMAGRAGEARRLLRAGEEVLCDVGGLQSAVAQQEALVDLLAGDPAAAEARLRPGYERLAAMGERALLADTAIMLARTLFEQGRLDEASAFCRVGEGAAAEDDLSAQVGWRSLRARLLAARGQPAEGAELAREAVALSEPTDFLGMRADALVDLGEVLRACGSENEAGAALRDSLELYRRKGDAVSAERVGSRLGAPKKPQEVSHAEVRDGQAG